MDRRRFVISASASALSGLAWLRTCSKAVLAASAANASSDSVFGALVTAVLPFEDPRFPKVDPSSIRARVASSLSAPGDSGLFEASIMLFDSIASFANPPAPLMVQEQALYGSPDLARESARFDAWSRGVAKPALTFTGLGLADQRSFLSLWATSALGVRRRLYQTVKTLIVVSAYSMPELWNAIEYEGPLVPGPHV